MDFLNYHHLRYFWTIANVGTLTAAAEELRISQSALSIQLRKLEESLGADLFTRDGRNLNLTEEGLMALDYAETIFSTGEELMSVFSSQTHAYSKVIRVGAASTLSRNFQIDFLHEAFIDTETEVIIRSGQQDSLLEQLEQHHLDLVLTNEPYLTESKTPLACRLIDKQPVSLVGRPGKGSHRPLVFPDDLKYFPLALPARGNSIRAAFDLIMTEAKLNPQIAAEADDMAMMRLFAINFHGLTLVPPVVVQGELKTGKLIEWLRVPGIYENFYAITASRKYENPIITELLSKKGAENAEK